MNEIGHYALCTAWLLTVFAIAAGIYAGKKEDNRWYLTTRNATIAVFIFQLIALGALAYLFLTDNYANQYVWQFSNRTMQDVYKFSAIWGGMDGSMLLWCFMLSCSAAILAAGSLSMPRRLMPWVLAVINTSSLFFLTVTVYFTNPFRYLNAPFIPPDGNGLNPLLQNPYMAIHPPTLYMGFTTLAVPYAFCMGALLAGELSNEWLRLTRKWTLAAWGFLTAGIVLGGHWAYLELGWGGFWAWDPVENASFLPWLTGTAFLHSVMVQERKNMLKSWNVWLIVLTYGLTVFGTFLTRSGVVQSVHAFASTDIGWVFLVYLGIIFGTALVLTFARRKELASERKIESFLSREAAFLVNNLLFLSICFAVLWGVLFPVLSEAVTGTKQTVGIPFFNAVNVPLFLLMIFMMGIGPLIAWKKAGLKSLVRTFAAPFFSALAVAAILVWAGITDFYPVLSYALCFFVLMTVFGEFHRGLRAQTVSADGTGSYISGTSRLIRRHRTRYIGYLVHVGVLVMTVSITASMAHKIEREFSLSGGETFNVGRFALTLDGLSGKRTENYEAVKADVQVKRLKDGEPLGTLHPEMRFYMRNKENTTEVALRMGPREDLYLVLAGIDESGNRASFKVFVNPLQIWLWVGTLIVLGATAALLVPRKQTSGAEEHAAIREGAKV
ncbi:MAG: heme lyase CcmF/NrfE family subunit [Deltaproteobacteria bacterium]|nr:heme lyase CcmF/NrfE family subunit [Deltaproteobacteria bacterium]